MLTAEQIADAKKQTKYSLGSKHHEHDDCIRIAYEWLDAQVKTKRPITRPFPVKHLIEKWAGRYVSASDVDVAATMHPDIVGKYPYFNISTRLTLPAERRLHGIEEAHKHDYKSDEDTYRRVEE